MNQLFPYNINELVGSEIRVLIAPPDITLPTKLDDIVAVIADPTTGAYAPKTVSTKTWIDLGATSAPPTYSQNLTTKERSIQQEKTGLLKRVDTIARSIQAQVAEVSPENIARFEIGGVIEELAAGAGHTAYRHVNVGPTSILDFFRIAWVGQLDPRQGVVVETGGKKRGRFVGRFLPAVQRSAGNSQVTLGEDGWILPLDLDSSPDPLSPSAKAEGFWFEETAGTIA